MLAPEKVAMIYRETLEAHILVRNDLGWDDERVTAKLYGSGLHRTQQRSGPQRPYLQ